MLKIMVVSCCQAWMIPFEVSLIRISVLTGCYERCREEDPSKKHLLYCIYLSQKQQLRMLLLLFSSEIVQMHTKLLVMFIIKHRRVTLPHLNRALILYHNHGKHLDNDLHKMRYSETGMRVYVVLKFILLFCSRVMTT